MEYITTVRARLRNPDQAGAMEEHNGIVGRLWPQGQPLGAIGHKVYANLQDPGEFLAIDRWSSIEGLQTFISDPAVQADLGSMFEGQPDLIIWAEREGWTNY